MQCWVISMPMVLALPLWNLHGGITYAIFPASPQATIRPTTFRAARPENIARFITCVTSPAGAVF